MKSELKWALYCIMLGGSLIAYAHSQFSSKDITDIIRTDQIEMKKDLREIRNYLIPKKK